MTKARIVEETLEPGASVAVVLARDCDDAAEGVRCHAKRASGEKCERRCGPSFIQAWWNWQSHARRPTASSHVYAAIELESGLRARIGGRRQASNVSGG